MHVHVGSCLEELILYCKNTNVLQLLALQIHVFCDSRTLFFFACGDSFMFVLLYLFIYQALSHEVYCKGKIQSTDYLTR